MKQEVDDKGYYRVQLFVGAGKKGFLIHRLVASAFIENPNDYPDINHKDFDPSNNYVGNLEWCTKEYNNKYSFDAGRYANKSIEWRTNHRKGVREKQGKKVVATRIKDGENLYYETEMDAVKDGHNLSSVSRCCNGLQRKHHGYKWRFATEHEWEQRVK